MKRFHVHVSVGDLGESVRFYSELFGTEPTVRKPDYAKWMLEDPRVNFAISTRRQSIGVNHLGFQVDSDEELRSMQAQLVAADAKMIPENAQSCCYARSNKYWVTDPSGIAWETFHTLESIPVFGEEVSRSKDSSCCVPVANVARPKGQQFELLSVNDQIASVHKAYTRL